MKSGENDKVKEYDIMRVVLTVMIVMDHALYLRMPFAFGEVDYSSPQSLGNCLGVEVYQLLGKVTSFFVFFQMPAFFFLSGAVFCLGMRQHKYPDLGILAENKARRLIYPAMMAGIFWMVPLKFLGNGYASTKVLPYAVFQGVVLGQNGLGHLWYLFTLFWVFMVSYVCLKYFVRDRWYMLAALILMLGTCYSVIGLNLPGAVTPAYYTLFFFIGYGFEQVREKLVEHIYITTAVMLVIAVISYRITSLLLTSGTVGKDWLKTLGISACTVLVFILCHFLLKIKVTRFRLYQLLEKHCFNIYLLHDPLNYIFLAAAAAVTGRISAVHPVNWARVGVLLPALRIFGNIACCIIISAVLRKIKFAKAGRLILAVIVLSMFIILYDNWQAMAAL